MLEQELDKLPRSQVCSPNNSSSNLLLAAFNTILRETKLYGKLLNFQFDMFFLERRGEIVCILENEDG